MILPIPTNAMVVLSKIKKIITESIMDHQHLHCHNKTDIRKSEFLVFLAQPYKTLINKQEIIVFTI